MLLPVESSRMWMLLGALSDGSALRPPGSSSRMSAKLDGCKCSMACFSILDDVVRPRFSWAVTTTSPSWLTSVSNKYRPSATGAVTKAL